MVINRSNVGIGMVPQAGFADRHTSVADPDCLVARRRTGTMVCGSIHRHVCARSFVSRHFGSGCSLRHNGSWPFLHRFDRDYRFRGNRASR